MRTDPAGHFMYVKVIVLEWCQIKDIFSINSMKGVQVWINLSLRLLRLYLSFSSGIIESTSLTQCLNEGGLADFHCMRISHRSWTMAASWTFRTVVRVYFGQLLIWIVQSMHNFKLNKTMSYAERCGMYTFQTILPSHQIVQYLNLLPMPTWCFPTMVGWCPVMPGKSWIPFSFHWDPAPVWH